MLSRRKAVGKLISTYGIVAIIACTTGKHRKHAWYMAVQINAYYKYGRIILQNENYVFGKSIRKYCGLDEVKIMYLVNP